MSVPSRLLTVLVASSLLSCVAHPTVCEAGCFDWLFRRNQPQTLPTAQAAAGQPVSTTAGYAPTESCGAGFCQQTVVKYMPQVAYRTAYQPVPVTTYKTSTSINPANGLPMTCTRPCTTYSYQARRVPYTTYRPVYTTVPVADPALAAAQAASPASWPPTATSLYPPGYATGYQPAAGCSSCQTGTSNVPGYTPGNGSMAPAPADLAPTLQNTFRPDLSAYAASGTWSPATTDPAGATPWQPVAPATPSPSPYGASYGNGSAEHPTANGSATPWQQVPSRGAPTSPPSGFNGSAADRPPSLQQSEVPQQRALKPVPLPESVRRSYYGDSTPTERKTTPPAAFETPRGGATNGDTEFKAGGTRPELQAPENQEVINQSYRRRWSPGSGYSSGAVKDLDRTPPSTSKPWTPEDRTAARKSLNVARQIPQRSSRYAAVPIDWRTQPKAQPQRPATEWVAR